MSPQILFKYLYLLYPILILFIYPIRTGDLSVWVALGDQGLSEGRIPTSDIHSFLSTSPMIYSSWITSFVYSYIFKFGGYKALNAFHAFIFGGAFYCLYKTKLTNLKFEMKSLIILLVSWYGVTYLIASRPMALSLIYLAWLYKCLNDFEEVDASAYIKLNLLMLLWVNTHGSFLLLPILLVAFFLGDFLDSRKLEIKKISLFISVILSGLVNPWGHKIYLYVLETGHVSKARGISEWETVLNGHQYFLENITFLVISLLALYYILKVSQSPWRWKFFYLSLLLLGFNSIRQASLFALFLLPIFSEHLRDEKVESKSALNFIIVAFFVAGTVIFSPWLKERFSFLLPSDLAPLMKTREHLPLTYQYLRNNPQKRLLNDINLGSDLMLNVPNKIMMDARNIIFSDRDFNRYMIFIAQPFHLNLNPQLVLDEYKIDLVLLDCRFPVVSWLALNWDFIHTEDKVCFFKKPAD